MLYFAISKLNECSFFHSSNPPPHLSLHEIFIVLILFDVASFLATIIFLAAAGNILVCVAIYTERSLRRIGNLFLASLAIADLFVSLLVMTFASVNDILGKVYIRSLQCKA